MKPVSNRAVIDKFGRADAEAAARAAVKVTKDTWLVDENITTLKPRMSMLKPLFAASTQGLADVFRDNARAAFAHTGRTTPDEKSPAGQGRANIRAFCQYGMFPTDGTSWSRGPHTKNRRIENVRVSLDPRDPTSPLVSFTASADFRIRYHRDREIGGVMTKRDDNLLTTKKVCLRLTMDQVNGVWKLDGFNQSPTDFTNFRPDPDAVD